MLFTPRYLQNPSAELDLLVSRARGSWGGQTDESAAEASTLVSTSFLLTSSSHRSCVVGQQRCGLLTLYTCFLSPSWLGQWHQLRLGRSCLRFEGGDVFS